MAENSWWEKRPCPDSFVWDIVEGAALVVTIWAFWEITKAGMADGYDYRYEDRR